MIDGVQQGFLHNVIQMQLHLAVHVGGRCLADETAGDPVAAAGARGEFLQCQDQAVFLQADGEQTARDAARLGVGLIDEVADSLRLRGLGSLFLLKPIAEDIHEVGDGGQLLANAVMQVVADAALLASADFQDLPFQSPALGDVAGDAFDLHATALLLDQAQS